MTVNALRLISKKSITSDDDFAISYLNGHTLSLFSDPIWDFSPYIENRNCKKSDKEINFKIYLPGGGRLTDTEHQRLLWACKGFLYARMTRPHPRNGKIVKPRTIVGLWFRIRPLMVWMLENNIVDFHTLTEDDAAAYHKYISSLNLAPNTVLKRLSVLEMLYLYSDYYPYSLTHHPWPKETSISLSGDRSSRSNPLQKQTQAIPSYVFAQLGRSSLDLIENQSERIVSTYAKCCDILREHRPIAIKLIDSGDRNPVVQEREFQIQYCSTRAKFRTLLNIVRQHDFNNYGDMNKAVRGLQTAAYIVCAMFSGLRDSELASLELGAFKTKTGLDGETYHWLYGKTYKLEAAPKNARWMVPECISKAVSVLEKITDFNRQSLQHQLKYLSSKERKDKNCNEIQDLERWSKSLFLTKANRGYTYKNIDNETANNRLRKFVKKHEIVDENGELWPISTHQFRRSFAVFVAKNLMGDLRYLRHHFKHWSLDMTLHYAKLQDGDESLISEVLTERDRLNRIIVSDWLTEDKPLAGGRGKSIMEFRSRNRVKTAKDLSDATTNLADGLFIRSTGHSWCLSNTESCGGQGLYDSLQCASCDNAVIDKSLIPAWKGIREHQEDILSVDGVGEPVRYHAKKQIAEATRIIEELSDEQH